MKKTKGRRMRARRREGNGKESEKGGERLHFMVFVARRRWRRETSRKEKRRGGKMKISTEKRSDVETWTLFNVRKGLNPGDDCPS